MIRARLERVDWPLAEPFTIARGTQTVQPTLRLTLTDNASYQGRGEACGIYYAGETIEVMEAQLATALPHVERGAGRAALPRLIRGGGARHLVDAALWDLEAKRSGISAFAMAGMDAQPIMSARTIGMRSLEAYEASARQLADYPLIKVKLDAAAPLEALAAVRRGAPKAHFIIDPNQSWSVAQLKALAPALADQNVLLIEQPIAVGAEAELDGWQSPIPLCADELIDDVQDLAKARGRFQAINIKLDKCGGLTAGLALADAARAQGFILMVGCMGGSSLSMAPAMVLAQQCAFVDLDGPLLQMEDVTPGFDYVAGRISNPWVRELWG